MSDNIIHIHESNLGQIEFFMTNLYADETFMFWETNYLDTRKYEEIINAVILDKAREHNIGLLYINYSCPFGLNEYGYALKDYAGEMDLVFDSPGSCLAFKIKCL